MSKHGEFSHIEFPADDVERAKTFYSNVFGWSFEAMDGFEGYFMYTAGPGGLGGGIGVRGQNAPAAVRNYIGVDDVDGAVARATASGGALVVPKTDIGFGWYAAVTDTEGNEIGLYKSKPQA
ncbi:MAG TPA: VOC family protein [Candidatus Limnocylindria bacterium]|nr:VOC family protein [Candidatus Limnocylindria bacterium]